MKMIQLCLALLPLCALSAPAWAQDAPAEPPAAPAEPAAQPAPTAPPQATMQATPASGSNLIRVGIYGNAAKILGDFGDFFALGFGFGARGGYELHFGELLVTPELTVNWNRWALSDPGTDASIWILGVLPGLRVGYTLGAVVPWLAFHGGLDHVDGGGSGMDTMNKFGWDAGAGLDLPLGSATIGPFFNYDVAYTDIDSTTWITFGVAGSFGL
jgi:hypothetical protein